ncbi:DNA (cytosine-5)-methyltransferase 1 [Pseudooceanicola antarcticus]|uniref:DNA (cytosine-5-)-methyltransferase n=1 Tax=Pseudooceanicola antarcticus TaxID=1247613 RepID=A0A285JKF6_9RHOB|nr:DNA cytosine methyltransferase [Pseudooceanicola antarcticus]PJE26497.1 DNA methyltransferase [Pseudooceanicola antarcticus]SNY60820.1 DNA (cytosine-5)-methyltransferase 1 [Pseudooceanicola antarcticus]
MDGAHLLDLAVSPRPAPLGPPLIVDSFAGGGGASTGIEMALGRGPDIAINHNPKALALHAANHPETLHLSENVYRVDPLDHLAGRHIGLMWFSPDCRHFSKAKGGAPVARNIRDLAWVIPGWIERIQQSGGQVDVVIMENVEEWKTWGPVIETPRGPMPCPNRRGETFDKWCKAIRKLGGRMETRELRACDYGAPTIRKRLFVIIRFDGQPIVWPEPTHGAPEDPRVIAGELAPWRTAAECIDWSTPCPSIFDSEAQIRETHGLRAVRPLADNTLARIARGVARYVLEAESPFVLHLNTSDTNQSLSFNRDVCYATSANGLGPCKPPLAKHDPLRLTLHGPHTPGDDTHTKRDGIETPEACRVLFPIGPFAFFPHDCPVVAPVLTYAQQGGRNRAPTMPLHTVCASPKDQNAVLLPTLIQTGYGERPGQAPRALDLGKPLGTIVAGGAKHATVAAFLAQHNGGPRMGTHTGHDARDPLSTVAASGSHQTPVAAFFAKYYGTGDGARTDAPCHTITVKDRMAHMQAALQAPPFTAAHEARAREVASFLRAHGAWDGGDLVTLDIAGTRYVIADIGMRMLTPRELFTAQGFPRDYVIEGVWESRGADWAWTSLAKKTQVSCVGNSVCPPVAAALVGANCGQQFKCGHQKASA